MLNVQEHKLAHPDPYSEGTSRQAIRFFILGAGSCVTAGLLMWVLCRTFGKIAAETNIVFPVSFIVSSFLLFNGDLALARALKFVRRERQSEFRFWLLSGFGLGTLFMGVQGYALWSIFPEVRTAGSATVESLAFILCLAALHGLHFLIGVLFVAFIISRTYANRYDHEYFWGVRICVWYWHFLMVVWIAILAIISIAL